MNKIIIPTGYMGSGSSAVTDLVSEFKGYSADNGSFEYVFLHCPNGVFDLEDKLLIGNNATRSDEAIHSFRDMMEQLYKTKFWWPANYKKFLSEDFMNITNEYLDELIQYRPNDFWYMQEKLTFVMFVQMCVRKVVRIVTGDKVRLKRPLRYEPMEVSMVSREQFYSASRKYLAKILKEMGIEEKNLILDQLLLPFNLHRMENYFDENAECFVIERDPRDMFISNKYIWRYRGDVVPYPTDVKDFCEYYKRLRAMEQKTDNPHVHRLHFEDLIYKYEESIEYISKVLGVSKEAHWKKGTCFIPEKSIHNTQMFRKEEYRDEMEIIERELKEYLYDFPYVKEVDLDKSF